MIVMFEYLQNNEKKMNKRFEIKSENLIYQPDIPGNQMINRVTM